MKNESSFPVLEIEDPQFEITQENVLQKNKRNRVELSGTYNVFFSVEAIFCCL